MTALTGPVLIVSLLLAVGGAAKIVAPQSTAQALRTLGWPNRLLLVRAMGAAELLLGAATVAVGGRVLPALTAAAYAGFVGFVVLARRRGTEVTSCGCFGAADSPPSLLHIVVNLAAVAVCVAGAAAGIPALDTVLADQPAAGIPFLAFAGLGVYGLYLTLTALPALVAPVTPAVPTFTLGEHPT